MASGPQIPVVLCLDVEPDGGFLDPSRQLPWHGYEQSVQFFTEFREQVEAQVGQRAAFSWFFRMDPQIAETYGEAAWAVRHYAEWTTTLVEAGDELGLHVHAYRWDASANDWVVDHGDQGWIDHCVRTSFEAFERALGRPCQTFRFGDHWMSNETMRLLDTLGVRHDLTLEPGQGAEVSHRPGHRCTGSLPDYSNVPSVPYRPTHDDYRRADPSRQDGLWVIPTTTAPVQPQLLRGLYYRAFFPKRPRGFWTALASHERTLFARIVDHALRRDRPYLALPLRVGALTTPRLARRVSANLTALLEHPLSDRFAWVTPGAGLSLLGFQGGAGPS